MEKLPIVKSENEYLYNRMGPWPQPQPSHPFGFSPGVVHIPKVEKKLWFKHVGLRYMSNIFFWWPRALYYIWRHPHLKPVTDASFEKIMNHTAISKFVSNELNEPREGNNEKNEKFEIFKEFLKAEPNEKFYVSDFSLIREVKPDPGKYVAPTMVLFKGPLVENKRKVVAIYFIKPESESDEKMFTPKDGAAWELAKYFALNGASMRISLSAHANLHFPYDCINAISKSSLPKDSLLSRLLLPHFSLTLELNFSVLNTSTSPLQNPKHMPYAALPASGANLLGMFIDGYHGIENNPSYPGYEFELEVQKMYSDYGVFLSAYYETIHKYVAQVVKLIPQKEYVDIKVWLNYVSHWEKGFEPYSNNIFSDGWENLVLKDEKNLAKIIAKIIWDLSVGHSADHYNYSTIDINKMPFIIRIPPPKSKDHPPLDRKKITFTSDILKHAFERKLFFRPKTVYWLKDLKYDFSKLKDEKKLDELNTQFLNELKETEKKLVDKDIFNYIPLDDIARSIQY